MNIIDYLVTMLSKSYLLLKEAPCQIDQQAKFDIYKQYL